MIYMYMLQTNDNPTYNITVGHPLTLKILFILKMTPKLLNFKKKA